MWRMSSNLINITSLIRSYLLICRDARELQPYYGSHASDPMSWPLPSNGNGIWETMKVL